MEHVAIMKKSWQMIDKIIVGEKTIESRWYQTKRSPWDKIKKDEIVYFKNSGEKIIVKAKVEKVKQYVLKNNFEIKTILKTYGKKICINENDVYKRKKQPKYLILVFLFNVKKVKPFNIDKTGYGCSCAWLAFPNKVKRIK